MYLCGGIPVTTKKKHGKFREISSLLQVTALLCVFLVVPTRAHMLIWRDTTFVTRKKLRATHLPLSAHAYVHIEFSSSVEAVPTQGFICVQQ